MDQPSIANFRYSKGPNHQRHTSNPYVLNCNVYSKEAQHKIQAQIGKHRRTKSQNSVFEMLKFQNHKPNKPKRLTYRLRKQTKSRTPTNSSSHYRLLGCREDSNPVKEKSFTRIRQGIYTIESCDYMVKWDNKQNCVKVKCGTKNVEFGKFMKLVRRFNYNFKEI